MRWWVGMLCLCSAVSEASTVDTVFVESASMHKSIPVVVFSPDKQEEPLPAVYLLHGFSDAYNRGWATKVPHIGDYADRYGCLLVIPDGGFDSWYFDSPVDSTYCYETFVSRELPDYVDAHYSTRSCSAGRAIAGNSMGGHGALFLALRHPDVFGAAGSMSGGVNLCPFSSQFGIAGRLGAYELYPERWKECSVVNLIEKTGGSHFWLIVDCGTDDFFYKENCLFHEKLLKLGIPHEFIVRPGKHDWTYWSIALQSQLLFFHRFFTSSDTEIQIPE